MSNLGLRSDPLTPLSFVTSATSIFLAWFLHAIEKREKENSAYLIEVL